MLCYEVNASLERSGNNLCHFEIYVGMEPAKYPKAMELIYQIIEKSKNDETLLQRARTLWLGRLALSYESTSGILMSAVGGVLNTGVPKSQKERMNIASSVTIEDVEKTVNAYLNPEMMAKVLLKPK